MNRILWEFLLTSSQGKHTQRLAQLYSPWLNYPARRRISAYPYAWNAESLIIFGIQHTKSLIKVFRFTFVFGKTLPCSRNYVAAQFKVLIVFHSALSLSGKLCSWDDSRRPLFQFEAKRWGSAIGLDPTHSFSNLIGSWLTSSSSPIGRPAKTWAEPAASLGICVAFGKDFPQAAQAYFSSGSTGFAQHWIGCMVRPQILNLKALSPTIQTRLHLQGTTHHSETKHATNI